MASRLGLHALLVAALGTTDVYFQPPTNLQMVYPCIVYKRSSKDAKFANNNLYRYIKQYTVTVIDRDPDSVIPDAVVSLPMCDFDRCFTTEGLNHDVFKMFF